jgi:hypothetical protein
MFAAVRREFARAREASATARSLALLREALEVHLLQEDELYYPAIWRLRPEQKARLQACVDADQQFRDRMREIEGHASRGDFAGVLEDFDALAEEFRRHELREEEVLRSRARDRGLALRTASARWPLCQRAEAIALISPRDENCRRSLAGAPHGPPARHQFPKSQDSPACQRFSTFFAIRIL